MSGDDKDYSKQPLPWSAMFPESTSGYIDAFGQAHPGNQPDLGEAGPHASGAKIAKQTAAEERAYRQRLEQVARFMEAGRESIRAGGPGADWPGWRKRLNELHELAEAEQAERAATTAHGTAKPSETASTARPGTRAPLPQPERISDDLGRRLLARWRRRHG